MILSRDDSVLSGCGWPFRGLCVCAVLPVLLLTGCEKSSPNPSGGPKADNASPISRSASIEITTKSGVEMVYLPGGDFMMGSDHGNADEAPAHRVKVSPFLMDKFEVTHELFTKAQLPNPSHWQDNPKKPI